VIGFFYFFQAKQTSLLLTKQFVKFVLTLFIKTFEEVQTMSSRQAQSLEYPFYYFATQYEQN